MVKIRLRRIGTKGRPFYRVVVAQSTAGRNGKFVETIGTYDPVVKPTRIEVNQDRALHWLRTGAQPTETTAYILNKIGVLEQYFQERPNARKQYSFLDKRTAATSVASVVDTNTVAAKKSEPKAEAPAPEPEAAPEVTAEVEAAPEASAEEPTEQAADEASAAGEEVPAVAETGEAPETAETTENPE